MSDPISTRFCGYCGSEIKDGHCRDCILGMPLLIAKVCPYCGQDLSRVTIHLHGPDAARVVYRL